MKVVEGMKDWVGLAIWLGVLYDSRGSLKDVVERFLKGQGHYQPSWRTVILALDGAHESDLANRIRSYGEPVTGRCTHNICTHIYTKIHPYMLCHAMA